MASIALMLHLLNAYNTQILTVEISETFYMVGGKTRSNVHLLRVLLTFVSD